jgi:ribosomal protein S18 acetylase RimI-like enzyme
VTATPRLALGVRAADTGDAKAIAPLLGELGYPADPEEVRRRLDRLLTRPNGGVLVAEVAGEVVGVASYQVIDLLERAKPHCRITALVTASEHRRRGAATALLRAIESAARAAGCFRLEVTTRPERTEALRFYTAHDFHERPRRLVKALSPPQ